MGVKRQKFGSGEKKPLSKAPDAEEIFEIAQTRNLYKSNLFRLQLEELLKELAPRSPHGKLDVFLKSLHQILLGLEARELAPDLRAEFPRLCFMQRKQPTHAFQFRAPSRVDVVGSFLLGTTVRWNLNVDLALEMPAESFQSKDYLNFRYGDKRAAYAGELHRQLLAHFANGDGNGDAVEVFFESLQGDPFRPCVVLKPCGPLAAKEGSWIIRLLPVCTPDLFPIRSLAPDRNALRPKKAKEGDSFAASAHYNSQILEDMRFRQHLELIHSAVQKAPELKDAILLLKKWAASRCFLQGAPAATWTPLNGFCLSILAVHASRTSGVATSQTSSYQFFKLALSLIATTDFSKQKLQLGVAAPVDLSGDEQKVFGAHLYDSDGHFNFFWRLGPFVHEMSSEAQRTLKLLEAQDGDPYNAVFGMKTTPELVWDLTVRCAPLPQTALTPNLYEGAAASIAKPGSMVLPMDMPRALRIAADLKGVLMAGLGDRCKLVSVRLLGAHSLRWAGTPGHGPPEACATVVVGLCLEATNLERVLDRGPSADNATAAEAFRALWGPKAQLRRFKDGSIIECVAWDKPPFAQATLAEMTKHPAVVTQIVRHLLGLHFAAPMPKVSVPSVISGPAGMMTNLSERSTRLWQVFGELKTHLGQLSSLPLTIKDIRAVDPAFSYTETEPDTLASNDGITRTLHHCIVEFESSGAWPESQEAVANLHTAFLLKMREELLSDLGIESEVSRTFLDVRYPEFAFRVRIFYPREFQQAAAVICNANSTVPATSVDSVELTKLRFLWWKPRIREALHSLVLQRPALAGAIRLVLRWLSSQCLSGYEDFAEHLTASAFLHPSHEVPQSPHVGLCRVLTLLTSFAWEREPLVIDIDERLSADDRLALRRCFERREKNGSSNFRFWVVTRFDPHMALLQAPPTTVALWLQKRAERALEACRKNLLSSSLDSIGPSAWRPIFELDKSTFDVIVRLRLPDSSGSLQNGKKKVKQKTEVTAPLLRKAAQRFVSQLRDKMSQVCLVFHDADNYVVALKMCPAAFLPQHHGALMGALPHTCHAPSKDVKATPLLVPDVLLLTSAVASLSEGLGISVEITGTV